MTAISDSSPLILFGRIDRLGLLHDLFGQIIVPPAVLDEVTSDLSRPAALEVATFEWIRRRELKSKNADTSIYHELGQGEAEAITLALETSPPVLVLLDDRKARSIAVSHGLNVTGSVGLLLFAKERGLVDSVLPVILELRDAGLYLSDSLVREIVHLTAE